jgi:hypothetical protein
VAKKQARLIIRHTARKQAGLFMLFLLSTKISSCVHNKPNQLVFGFQHKT